MRRIVFLLLAALTGCALALDDFSGGAGGGAADAGNDAADVGVDVIEAGGAATEGGADADASSNHYASTILADSPVLYLRFGEAGGTTAAAAAGPNGVYTPSGIKLGTAGAIAGDPDTAAMLTDGSGSITVPGFGSFDGLATFSVEIWVNPATNNAQIGFVLDNSDYADRKGWNLLAGTDSTAFERYASDTSHNHAVADPLPAGQWHHLVGTFDGSTQRLYVDGIRVAGGPSTLAIPTRTSTFTVGHQSCCGGQTAFLGAIDELAIYTAVLTDTQVAAHYAAAK